MIGKKATRSTAALAAHLVIFGPAAAADPKVPPAVEQGNRAAVAIITSGFDYTRPEIAELLARDGEGEIIAWDVLGEDRFPYDAAADTEIIAGIAAQLGKNPLISLLAVKASVDDPASMAKALAFVARTPATTVIVPMWSSQPGDWELFSKAARHFASLRIVVRSCPDLPAGGPAAVYPRDLGLPNTTFTSAPAGDPAAAAEAFVTGLPCQRP